MALNYNISKQNLQFRLGKKEINFFKFIYFSDLARDEDVNNIYSEWL